VALKPTKTNAKVLVELLMEEHEDVEELALALMTKSFEVYEQRAKFVVVGQSAKAPAFEGERAGGVCFGAFATKKQAEDAAESLVYSVANPNEPMHVWVLTRFNGTPHQYHSERNAERKVAELGVTSADRLSAMYRSAAPGSPQCGHVLDLDGDLNLVMCALFKYHPGDHLLQAEAEKERCQGNVPVPGDRHSLRKCDHYMYHPGPCEAEAPTISEEEHDETTE